MKGDAKWFGRRDRTDGISRDRTRVRTRRRPRLEVSFLEDRRLLTAVIPVTSTADSGPGTLREVIGEANAATQPVEIRFDLKGGATITLTSGQLELTNTAQPIDIVGPGADRLDVDGNGASRVFAIDPGVTASISGVSITGGFAESGASASDSGAGLLNQGDLGLVGVTVAHNTTAGFLNVFGGGLENLGMATVVGCTFAGNVGGYGGGMGNSGLATLVGCTFVGNTAQSEGGGFGGEQLGPELQSSELIDCSFTDNTADNNGGGLGFRVYDSGPLQFVDCVIRDNQTFGGGGGLSIIGDSATTVTMTGCLIEDNLRHRHLVGHGRRRTGGERCRHDGHRVRHQRQ